MSFSIKGIPALQRRLKAVEKAASTDLLKRIQTKAVYHAKKQVPRKTGNLGRSIRPGFLTRSYAIVRASAGYAAYVELGTKPHDIPVGSKGFLAWPATAAGRLRSGAGTARAKAGNVRPIHIRTGRSAIGPNSGTYRYTRKAVHHPGTKPQPYLLPGAKQAVSEEVGREPIIRAWNGAA